MRIFAIKTKGVQPKEVNPMNNSEKLFDKPYRHRHILIFIKLVVVLHIFLSSEDTKAILNYAFQVKVSGKTICQWSKKFPEEIPQKKIKYKRRGILLHLRTMFVCLLPKNILLD